jgi:hypothetical protein
MLFNKSGRIFFSAAEFYDLSGRIILKGVGNTDRRAKNAAKFS